MAEEGRWKPPGDEEDEEEEEIDETVYLPRVHSIGLLDPDLNIGIQACKGCRSVRD